MADPRITQIIRGAGGIVHSDGNIFFTNQAQFLQAATQAQQPAQQSEKIAPVQGYRPGIPWSLHLEAYDAYCKKWAPQPALIDLEGRNCRGGFHVDELDEFVPGWRDRVAAAPQQPAQQAWPKASVVGRKDDMSPDDTLTLCLDGDNDVIVTVREGKRLSSSVEFCNGGGGGGASPRTRAALIALMVAMEADNATRPDRASGIALPPPRSQVQGGLSTDRHTS